MDFEINRYSIYRNVKRFRRRWNDYGKTEKQGERNSVEKMEGRLQKKYEENRGKKREYRRNSRQQESAQQRESARSCVMVDDQQSLVQRCRDGP